MTRVAASKARDGLSKLVNRAAYKQERIVLRRRGKDMAAIVSMEDLALLERIEDEIDLREARKALAEMKRKKEKPIPYEKVRRELGLE